MRIGNADQVLLLLRAHLQKAQTQRRKDSVGAKEEPRQRPVERVQTIAETGGLGDAELSRALIAGVLTEEFGHELANDARFQQVVTDVSRMIESDDEARTLLLNALAQIKGSAE